MLHNFLPALFASAAMMSNVPSSPVAPTFLALGDSYTIGEGAAPEQRWPEQLVKTLSEANIAVAKPDIIARTGWTTDELSAAMAQHTLHPPYALVTLMIGVNNQYRGRALDNYREEFRALLRQAIALAGDLPAHVVVVSIPDWGVTRFGRDSGRDVARVAAEIDAFNAVNAAVSAELKVRYADVTAASRLAAANADMLMADGLHPSPAAYGRWLDAILPQAEAALAAH